MTPRTFEVGALIVVVLGLAAFALALKAMGWM